MGLAFALSEFMRQMGSVLHRYGYTRGFLAGFSQGMGMGTENLNPP
jgi:hypothetical protein